MTAPAGALPVFPHCRSSECSPQERYLYFLTAPAVSAPAGVLPIFPHCRSSARSSRSFSPRPLPSPYPTPPPPSLSPPTTALPLSPSQQPHATIGIPPQLFSSLPQQCLLQQEPSLYFPTAAAVPAPAGSFSIFPHCPSSDCSRRSTIYFPTTAVVSAPAGALSIFPTAAAVPAPARAFSTFSHCPSSVCSRRSATCISSLPQ